MTRVDSPPVMAALRKPAAAESVWDLPSIGALVERDRPHTSPATTFNADAIASKVHLKRLRMQQEKEFAEVRARLAMILKCAPEEMGSHPAVIEAQKLYELDKDADGGEPDVGVYQDILEAHVHRCDPFLDIIKQRMERLYLPLLCAEEQREWKMLFTNPTTREQKSELFAALKAHADKDRIIARKRLENERRAANDQVLHDNNTSLAVSGGVMEGELTQHKSSCLDIKLSAENMHEQLHRVHSAVKQLPGSETLRKLCVSKSNKSNSSRSNPEPLVTGSDPNKKRDTASHLSTMLHKLILDNERLQRTYDKTHANTLLYSAKLKAMRRELKDNWTTGKCVTSLPRTHYFEPLIRNLENARVQVEFTPDPNIHCVSTTKYEPIGEFPANTTALLQLVLGNEGKEDPNARKWSWTPLLVHALAQEFGRHCVRSSLMAALMHDLEDLNQAQDEVEAFNTLTLIMEKTVQCHTARFWLPMKNEGGYWAKMYGGREVMAVMASEKNVVCSAFATGEIQNVADVYTMKDYDKSEDLRLGYRTKAVLCVPVRAERDGPVVCVLQAINKVIPSSSSFSEFDGFLLHVIGSAYMQVVLTLQFRLNMKHLAERKNILICVAEELFRKTNLTQRDLLGCFHDRLTQLFAVTGWALILCGDTVVERLRVGNTHAEVVATAPPDEGLVGICISKKELCHYETVEEQHRALRAVFGNARKHRIDLETDGRLTLWPIVDMDRVVAIIQFSQTPNDSFAKADHLGFSPSDPEHLTILKKFFAMIQYFLEKWWPQGNRFGDSVYARRETNQVQNVFSTMSSRTTGLDVRAFAVFRRLISGEQGGEDWADDIVGHLATKIQRMYRVKLAYRRAAEAASIPENSAFIPENSAEIPETSAE